MQNIFKPSWNGYPIIFLIETVVRKLPFLNRDAIKTINDGTEGRFTYLLDHVVKNMTYYERWHLS